MAPNSKRLKEPIFVTGTVVHGFGRGSKQLGIPTANLHPDSVQHIQLESGIYFGFSQLIFPEGHNLPKQMQSPGTVTLERNRENPIYPTVLSLGWNPHFDDVTERSLEAHLLHCFDHDFYDSTIRIAICGFIRNELKFSSMQELIDAIHDDMAKAREALSQPEIEWQHVISNAFFHV